MPVPKTWDEFLAAPVIIVSTGTGTNTSTDDSLNTTYKYERTLKRVTDLGFKNTVHINSVSDTIEASWKKLFGNKLVKFNTEDTAFIDTAKHSHKQRGAIGHFNAYKHILESGLDFAFVIEDGVVFHKDWEQLASKYFEVTPPDYALCYVGHHCGNGVDAHVLRIPVYSMHATIVTSEGAQYLLDNMLFNPNGVKTLDCMINEAMTKSLVNQTPDTDSISDDFCNWYAWNAEMFPDNTAAKYPEFAQKDTGLVFLEKEN